MAGQRVIAQNQLSRVRIANRGIATPLNVWTPSAAAGLAINIGDLVFLTPGSQPANFQDATVRPAPFAVPPNAAFLAATGPQTCYTVVGTHASNSTVWTGGVRSSVAWNGGIYGAGDDGAGTCVVRKRATPLAAPTAGNLFSTGAVGFQSTEIMFATASRLFLTASDASAIGSVGSITNDTTWTGMVSLTGAANSVAQTIAEGAVGGGVFLCGTANSIARTANSGASWVNILAGASSYGRMIYNPTDAKWYVFTGTGVRVSTDNGLSFGAEVTYATITNGVVPAQSYFTAISQLAAFLDVPNQRFIIVTGAGPHAVRTATPATIQTAWTTVASALPAMSQWTQTGAFIIGSSTSALCFCGVPAPDNWFTAIPVPWGTTTFPAIGVAMDAGDGCLSFDLNPNEAAKKLCWQFCDGVKQFDRATLTPYPATNGKKPYFRVT